MAFAGFALTDTLGLMEYFARGTELPPLDITPEQRFLLQDALYELGLDRIPDFLALLPQNSRYELSPEEFERFKSCLSRKPESILEHFSARSSDSERPIGDYKARE